MAEPLFNVILEGTVRPGRARPEVVETLTTIFKKDRDAVERLLDATPRKIRQGIDLRTAEKYRRIIEKAGAFCRIEPVDAPEAPLAAPSLHSEVQSGPETTSWEPCPRCGYVPASEDDVMIVRGDCPKCGLMVKGKLSAEASETDASLADSEIVQAAEDTPDILAAVMSASMSRRALASIYTFGCFSAVYCGIVLLFVLLFIPLTSVPRYIAQEFLVAAYTVAPAFMAVLSILVVSFIAPLFNRGRSWGQRVFTIELLYTPEAQSGGLATSLAFRTAAILSLSLAPGLVVVWSFSDLVPASGAWGEPAIMAAMALIGWSVSWLTCLMSTSRRSLLDHAGGTIQTEVGVMPPHAFRRACGPLLLVLLGLCILGVVSRVYPMLGR